jgi:acyl-CoA dehydrogenase
MQTFGAMGTGPDTPLAEIWTEGRALRIADGPDEVHRRTIAKLEIAASRQRRRASADYLRAPQPR